MIRLSRFIKVTAVFLTLFFLTGVIALAEGESGSTPSTGSNNDCLLSWLLPPLPNLPPLPSLPPLPNVPCWPPCPSPSPSPSPSPGPTPEATPPPSVGDGPSNGGSGQPSGCGATVPSAPLLLSAIKSGSSQAVLSWTAVEPATHYALSYGLSSGNYLYGVGNTGKVTSFTVGELDPAVDYCFAVRAVNDCAPSGLSNEICTGGQVLGVSTLGATGSFADELFRLLFIISNVCFGLGLKLFLPAKKAV